MMTRDYFHNSSKIIYHLIGVELAIKLRNTCEKPKQTFEFRFRTFYARIIEKEFVSFEKNNLPHQQHFLKMESPRTDFLTQYKAITLKLKKRFLRKPNISEASSQFGRLARELENQECPHYAAFCCLAVARCERSIGNPIYESQNLLHAARMFLEAEQQSHKLLCPSFSEHLQAALSGYRECIKVYMDSDQPALAASLYLEIGQSLRQLDRISESIPYFLKAADLHKCCSLSYINDLKDVSYCQIKIGDYYGALTTLTEIQVTAERDGVNECGERIGAYSTILNEVEVSRLLLLFLLQPPRNKINAEHEKLLDRYANVDIEPVDYMDEDMYLLLQSLQIAIEDKDEENLLLLAQDLNQLLTAIQNDILEQVVQGHRAFSIVLPIGELPPPPPPRPPPPPEGSVEKKSLAELPPSTSSMSEDEIDVTLTEAFSNL